jgi:hypothetical protein
MYPQHNKKKKKINNFVVRKKSVNEKTFWKKSIVGKFTIVKST